MLASTKKAAKECFQKSDKPIHFHLIPDRTVNRRNIPALESILGTKKFFVFPRCGDKEKLLARRLS